MMKRKVPAGASGYGSPGHRRASKRDASSRRMGCHGCLTPRRRESQHAPEQGVGAEPEPEGESGESVGSLGAPGEPLTIDRTQVSLRKLLPPPAQPLLLLSLGLAEDAVALLGGPNSIVLDINLPAAGSTNHGPVVAIGSTAGDEKQHLAFSESESEALKMLSRSQMIKHFAESPRAGSVTWTFQWLFEPSKETARSAPPPVQPGVSQRH